MIEKLPYQYNHENPRNRIKMQLLPDTTGIPEVETFPFQFQKYPIAYGKNLYHVNKNFGQLLLFESGENSAHQEEVC